MGLINNSSGMVLKLSRKGQALKLTFKGTEADVVSCDDIDNESVITIGRADDCTWKIPQESSSVSRHHACIFRKKGNVFIKAEENSSNGILLKGIKIPAEHKLSVGEKFTIGDCLLSVEKQTKQEKIYHPCHRLEQLNGAKRGTVYKLEEDVVTVGSKDDQTICLKDSRISSEHLKLVREWKGNREIYRVKDVGGGEKNGSKVNGEDLKSEGDGRFLSDGDIISVAYIDLRFLDKTKEHIKSYLFLKIAAVIVTCVVLIGGYFFYLTVAPSAKKFIGYAREAATCKEFDQALNYLQKAEESEGADIHSFEISELREQIRKWQETVQKWQQVRQLLVRRQWLTANHTLSPLVSGNMEFWRWNNTDATTAKNEAVKVKRFLDIFLQSRADLMSGDATLASLQQARQRLAAELAQHSERGPEHIAALRTSARDILEELDKTCKCWEIVVNNISAMKQSYNMHEALKNITQAQAEMLTHFEQRKHKRVSPRIIPFINEYLLPLRKLSEAQRVLDANYVYCAQFRFEKIIRNLPLPGLNECSVDPVLSDMRRAFVVLNGQLFENAKQLRNIVSALIRQDLVPGKKPEAIKQLYNAQILEAVLRCDTFDYPLAAWNRPAGVGEYDKMLGTEVFFDYLRALPDDFDSGKLSDLKFRPVLFQVRDCYAQLKAFLAFTEQKNMVMVCNNKCSGNLVAEWIIYADDMLNERNRFVSNLVSFSKSDNERAGIIAGGIALLLNGELSRDTAFVTGLSKKVKNNRRKISDILRKASTPEAVIKSRKQVLQLGIPGDSLLKHSWSEYYKK